MTGQPSPQGPEWWQASDGQSYPPQPSTTTPRVAPPSDQPAPQYVVLQSAGTNGLAIASLVLGIVWLYWIGSILAVIFGHVALNQISKSGQGGRGLAIAGLVLGWIGVAFLALFVIGIVAAS